MDSPQSFPDNNSDDHTGQEPTQGEVHTALTQAMRDELETDPLAYEQQYESPPTTPVADNVGSRVLWTLTPSSWWVL